MYDEWFVFVFDRVSVYRSGSLELIMETRLASKGQRSAGHGFVHMWGCTPRVYQRIVVSSDVGAGN